MNASVKKDEETTIGCNAWPGVKIGGNTKVGGNAGCITGVEVGADWFF